VESYHTPAQWEFRARMAALFIDRIHAFLAHGPV